MKIRKLYSNKPEAFLPIVFQNGLNVILGCVRKPKNRKRDTHNLGKTLLAQLIDFCLLKQKNTEFFLFKNVQFSEFIFFLEIETDDGSFITIRRSVIDASKISFITRAESGLDLASLPEDEWDHWQIPFDRSKEILDSNLNLLSLKPWTFRSAISYALRTQKDYDEPFKLAKFAGSHSEWKPFLAHVLGLNDQLVTRGYKIDSSLESLEVEGYRLIREAGDLGSGDKLKGLIEIAERELNAMAEELDGFNLEVSDRRITRELVDEIDSQISFLNERRYILLSDHNRIKQSIEHKYSLNLKDLSVVFEQAKIYFGEQIVKDYSALEKFNKEIVEERDQLLKQQIKAIESEVNAIERGLHMFNAKRTEALKAISNAEAVASYKRMNRKLASRQTEIDGLKRRYEAIEKLKALRQEIRALMQERDVVRDELEEAITKGSDLYTEIRMYFDDIVYKVINKHGNLYTRVNAEGNIEFKAEIVDDMGRSTSAGDGFSYGRLLCIAFDMAIQRAYARSKYPHFTYHDGVLETLDDRKKVNLIDLMHEYCRIGTQQIITVIETELPLDAAGQRYSFPEEEVILRLHDEDNTGRLFRMSTW